MKKMLIAISLVACLQVVFVSAKRPDFITDEIMEMLKDDKARCMGEHGTTEALIEDASDGKVANDRSITCYMYCLFEAFSLVDDEANLEVDMMVGFLPDNLQGPASAVLEVCAKETGSDPCDRMYNVAQCIIAKKPDLWLMV